MKGRFIITPNRHTIHQQKKANCPLRRLVTCWNSEQNRREKCRFDKCISILDYIIREGILTADFACTTNV